MATLLRTGALCSLLLCAAPAAADDAPLAVQQTQQLLQDPTARAAALQNDPAAKEADARAQAAVGGSPANTEELYRLASQIFASLAQETGGDAQKLAQLLAEAQANPEAFAQKLTPEQQAQLKALAQKMPAAQGGK